MQRVTNRKHVNGFLGKKAKNGFIKSIKGSETTDSHLAFSYKNEKSMALPFHLMAPNLREELEMEYEQYYGA